MQWDTHSHSTPVKCVKGSEEEKKLDQVRKEADLGPVSGTSSLVPVCDSQANPLVKEGDGLMFSLTSNWIHLQGSEQGMRGPLEWAGRVKDKTTSWSRTFMVLPH